MKRLLLVAAGVALAAVPAVFGLTDNPSLSHSVPVRIPSGAVPVTEHHWDNTDRVGHDTATSGEDRRGTAADSGKGGHAPAVTRPATSGKDRRGAAADNGKDGHAPAATRPATSGKDRRGAADNGKDGQAPAATPTAFSGKDGHAAPDASASTEKGRGPASMPETSVTGQGGNRDGGSSHAPGGGSSSGGSGSGGSGSGN